MIEQRVERAAGRALRSLEPVKTRGYARAFHAIATFEDDSTAFVKAGAEAVTSAFLRDELRSYLSIQGPFMPGLLGYDEKDPPLLVLEDLSLGRWPPPWDPQAIAAVRGALEAIWATGPPKWVPPTTDDREELAGGWAEIESAPAPFLSLRIRSPEWLDDWLPRLRAAAESAPIEGDALLHLDVRSDNICLMERGAVVVDWNLVHRGNPDLDLAGWAPSLRLEGGPPPHELLPDAGGLAALLAGFFGCRAGLPPPPTAPTVRELQRAQLEVALEWAERELA
ncbi:MAG TPA: hypothetical protein VNB86_11815 [Gaiellaceae bacterium]|nr:hypothetical protein [Gaiellaceae bacterium]